MHPVSTLLFLVGYALVLPIALRRAKLDPSHLRLALSGHQLGLFLAGVGWLMSGRPWVAAAHLGWAVAARAWFQAQQKTVKKKTVKKKTGGKKPSPGTKG